MSEPQGGDIEQQKKALLQLEEEKDGAALAEPASMLINGVQQTEPGADPFSGTVPNQNRIPSVGGRRLV